MFLIEHILKTGSANFYDSMRQEISKLKYLHSFSFVDDESKADKGETSNYKRTKEFYFYLKKSPREIQGYSKLTRK